MGRRTRTRRRHLEPRSAPPWPTAVDTVPDATLAAFVDHGEAKRTLDTDLPSAWNLLARLRGGGVDLDSIGETLQVDGLKQFEAAFDRLLTSVA